MQYIIPTCQYYAEVELQTLCTACWLTQLGVPAHLHAEIIESEKRWLEARCPELQAELAAVYNSYLRDYDTNDTPHHLYPKIYDLEGLLQVLMQIADDAPGNQVEIHTVDVACISETPHAMPEAKSCMVKIDADFLHQMQCQNLLDDGNKSRNLQTETLWQYALNNPDNVDFAALKALKVNIQNIQDLVGDILDVDVLQDLDIMTKPQLANFMFGRGMALEEILARIDVANLDTKSQADIMVCLLRYASYTLDDLQTLLQCVVEIDWTAFRAAVENYGLIIHHEQILLWCLQQNWPIDTLARSICRYIQGPKSEYMPFWNKIATWITPTMVRENLASMLMEIQDGYLPELLISEYLDPIADHDVIIEAVLTMIGYNWGYLSVIQACLAPVEMSPDNAHRLFDMAIRSVSNPELIIWIAETYNLKLLPSNFIAMMHNEYEFDMEPIFNHDIARNISLAEDGMIWPEFADNFTAAQDADAEAEAEAEAEADSDDEQVMYADQDEFEVENLYCGLKDITLMEIMIFVWFGIDRTENIMTKRGETIDWHRLNQHYVYQLESESPTLNCELAHTKCRMRQYLTPERHKLALRLKEVGVLDARMESYL